jgi:rhodanese-related sulfurtransferase
MRAAKRSQAMIARFAPASSPLHCSRRSLSCHDWFAGARNVPFDELTSRMHDLEPVKDRPIVIVCLTDRRSAKAAALLRAVGFDDVRALRGGMAQWIQNALPVQRPATPLPPI